MISFKKIVSFCFINPSVYLFLPLNEFVYVFQLSRYTPTHCFCILIFISWIKLIENINNDGHNWAIQVLIKEITKNILAKGKFFDKIIANYLLSFNFYFMAQRKILFCILIYGWQYFIIFQVLPSFSTVA